MFRISSEKSTTEKSRVNEDFDRAFFAYRMLYMGIFLVVAHVERCLRIADVVSHALHAD